MGSDLEGVGEAAAKGLVCGILASAASTALGLLLLTRGDASARSRVM